MTLLQERLVSQINEASHLLTSGRDKWNSDFHEYAKEIISNTDKIKANKEKFHELAPLFLYMPVREAKGSANLFSLRYKGLEVAGLKVDSKTNELTLVGKKTSFSPESPNTPIKWQSKEAAAFRNYYKNDIQCGNYHKLELESKFLEELEKNDKASKIECLVGVRPVKIADCCRFKLPTPLAAAQKLELLPKTGAGIDILARRTVKGVTNLCVMEVKAGTGADDPDQAMLQSVAYAVFVQELMDSASGPDWYEIFGFERSKYERSQPNKINIDVCVVMPITESNQKQLVDYPQTLDTGKGRLELHYILLNQDWDQGIKVVKTSFQN
ncbi:MAG: hypothetical protein LBT38_11060 [Deltaproteobacteria bacterium]|jgi:hypothetical protein|nr:hypothetical protein [Deltaproteobacteria bacterium]